MRLTPFDRPGRYWRGNLHAHSTVSDGVFSPEAVCRRYREAGYDFLSLTEHFMQSYGYPIVDTTAYRTDGFTTLIGAELHGPQTELGGPWHIVAVGLPQDFAAIPDESGQSLAKRAMDAGAYVTVAHPQWYSLTEKDIGTLDQFHAIEVFNGVAVDHNDRPDSWPITDIVMGRGRRCLVNAADDLHGFDDFWDFQRGWVWVKSERLTPEELLSALKEGVYYSSTGPQIHDITISPERIATITCSPAERVFITGMGPASTSKSGRGLTHVELDLSKFNSPYGRVTVRDAIGGRAWSNPFWFDELAF